jgi:DNA-directed RNA polymerase specialized sigma24 family protein
MRECTEIAIEENWCALALCILSRRMPEEALCYMRTGHDDEHLKYRNRDVADQDVIEMLEMRNAGVKYRDIGMVFGIKAQSVYSRIYHYRLKLKAEGE